MSQVSFELITRTSEVPEKNVPVLHVKLPTRNATDEVVRKATEQDKTDYAEAYQAFLSASAPAPKAAPVPAPVVEAHEETKSTGFFGSKRKDK